MIRRFSLYGFLKNQQYYDAFIILAFREKGLSFAMIGMLIFVREICTNLMEIPTGAIADVFGRRRSMIFSFVAYICSFLVFGFSDHLWMLFAAMFCYSIGDAFRTGTHKAMIFTFLANAGRSSEKTKTYGLTRSWSKMGSFFCVIIATGVVFVYQQYSILFLLAIGPYLLNIVNFLTYPDELDGSRQNGRGLSGIGEVLSALKRTLLQCINRRRLRRLLIESMGFGGTFKVSKDYLQPIIKHWALALPVLLFYSEHRRVAVLVGAVYCVQHLLSSFASRKADAFSRWSRSPRRGANRLWIINLIAFMMVTAGVLSGVMVIVIVALVTLAIIQNLWRPILIGRIAGATDDKTLATVLSTESQTRSLFTAAIAPLLGLAVDWLPNRIQFLPIGLGGMMIAIVMLVTSNPRKTR